MLQVSWERLLQLVIYTKDVRASLNYLLIIELIASVSLMKRNYWITFVTCVSTDNLFVQFTYSLTLFDLCVRVGPQLIWQLHNNSVGFKADAVSNDVHIRTYTGKWCGAEVYYTTSLNFCGASVASCGKRGFTSSVIIVYYSRVTCW